MFKFKPFQIQDYARAALHDGAICAHDKGLGKTLAAYTWCLLKAGFEPVRPLCPRSACLLVAPGDAHDQFTNDGRDLLGVHTTALDSQETFLRLSTAHPTTGRRELPPGFYLTTYTALASNGVAQFPDPAKNSIAAMMAMLNLDGRDVERLYQQRGEIWKDQYAILEVTPFTLLNGVEANYRSLSRHASDWRKRELDLAYDVLRRLQPDTVHGSTALITAQDFNHTRLTPEHQDWFKSVLIQRTCLEYNLNIGESRALRTGNHKVKCVYSPSLADLCSDAFTAVAVDEGVKMKGEDTIIGLGIRQMNPKYRLVLSGTPIKNRLPDIFRLAHWATGGHDEPSARWPYAAASSERESFAEEFLLSERNLSKEKKSETNRRYVKLSPQVCNIHRLWKLFGPIIIRRLKKDIGEQLVKKHRHVIRVPMGSEQARVYRHHIEGEYKDCNGMKAVGAQLQALRIAAAAPHCSLLKYANQPNSAPPSLPRSSSDYIPKFAAALTLIEQVLMRGEQIALFSALIEPLETMARRLDMAGVPYVIAHGGHSPVRRRKLSADFKRGWDQGRGKPVMLASGECMAEAHSWHLCNNAALLAYSWAFDKLSQAIDRCHRLNSVKDLNYYALLCDGTVDLVLENNLQEKNDTSDLVLDGQLLETNPKEVSLAEILSTAAADFNPESKTLSETDLEVEWPALRERLRAATRRWQTGIVPPALPTFPPAHLLPVHPWAARLQRRLVPA